MNKRKKFTLIVNPLSSSYKQDTIAICKNIFIDNNCDIEVKEIAVNNPNNFIPYLKGLIFQAFFEGRVPISSGGDGTFSAMQQAYVQLSDEGIIDFLLENGNIKQPIVAHIGMGASNDMNINLGFTQNPLTNTKLIINGQASPRDIVIVNGVPMGYSAIGGLGAHVPYVTPSRLKRESHVLAYIKYAFYDAFFHAKEFFHPLFKPYTIEVTLDDEEPFVEKAHIFGIFKGVQFASLQLLESDEMTNGKINYMSVKDLVDLSFKVVQGFTPGAEIEGVKQAKTIKLRFVKHKPDYPLDLDGEKAPFDYEEGISAEIHPKKMLIMTPKKY